MKATILSIPSMQVLKLHASLQAAQTPSSKGSHAAIFCQSPTTVASSLQRRSDLYIQRNTERLHSSAMKPNEATLHSIKARCWGQREQLTQ